MTVYVVWSNADEPWIDGAFTTRELADAYLERQMGTLRKEYDRLVDKAGNVIPRQGYKDGKGGIIPQREPHPGSFEDWCRSHGFGWIDELEVLDSLPA